MCVVFRPSQGLASRNIPATLAWRIRFVGEGRFLWFVSFGPAKEMNRPRSGRTLLGSATMTIAFFVRCGWLARG
jgi:hypothetical protein